MATITIIRGHSDFANVDDDFRVAAPGSDPDYDGFTETVERYELPEGYRVGECQMPGCYEVYKGDRHVGVYLHRRSNCPQIADPDMGPFGGPVLRPAA